MYRCPPFWLALAAITCLSGCPTAEQPLTQVERSNAPSVQLVQAPEKARSTLASQDDSLFDSFADLAREELPDDPEGQLPQFPPRIEEGAGPPAFAEEDESELIEFFMSPEWADIKEEARRNILLANRQARVKACQHLNVILIVIDDLGYGDVGVYGQQKIKTPNIDLLAQTGVKYTNYYAGSSVGVPSHCTLLTGLHTGHCRLRGNSENAYLPTQDITLAEAMFMAGLDTAVFGNWKLGDEDTPGTPIAQGFQESYGYLDLAHSKNYYPNYLYRNDERQPIPGNQNGGQEHYSLDLITDEAVDYLRRPRQRPFFMMVSLAPPRGDLDDVPSLEPYAGEDWPREQKQYAAMVSRVDEAVGRIMNALYRRNMKENTVVVLTSDNGPHKDGVNPEFFNSNGPFNGIKATLHEGGIRVPMIVWGPSDIVRAAGGTSHHVWWAPDVMPTLLDLVQAWRKPLYLDGVSQLDLWRGRLPPVRTHLYWELHEDGFAQAVRMGDWKAIRTGPLGAIKLYNLEEDVEEENDVAESHPEIVRRIADIMKNDRFDAAAWPIKKERIAQ